MTKLIVGNWKQNKTLIDVESWLLQFEGLIKDIALGDTEVVICPPAPYLTQVSEFYGKYEGIHAGVQDVSEYVEGQHTGEISAQQDADFANFCIVGHSERGESRELALKKAKNCMLVGLVPIVCFVNGEELKLFDGLEAFYLWEDPATISKEGEFVPKSADAIADGIKQIKKEYNTGLGLLYGGSVNRNNVSDLAKIKELDGIVSGSASLDANHFFELISAFIQ